MYFRGFSGSGRYLLTHGLRAPGKTEERRISDEEGKGTVAGQRCESADNNRFGAMADTVLKASHDQYRVESALRLMKSEFGALS